MSFLEPYRLYLLLALLALVVLYLLAQRRRRTYAVRFTQLDLLDKVAPRRPGWRRHVPAAAFLIALGLLVIGFARPQRELRIPRESATVVVAVDTSISMEATDVSPNRLEAAKRAADRFVNQLPANFAVGLTSFDGTAQIDVPPTRDRAAVSAGIDRLRLGQSTAIGEGVFASLKAIADSQADVRGAGGKVAPARIVLLSDGSNTVGRSPEQAAQAATAAKVPVSTIAYGTDEGTIELQGRTITVPVDGPSLRQLAEATGGNFYEAESQDQITKVYQDIGQSIGYRLQEREITTWFIGAALIAALLAAAASLRWFARLP